MPDLSERLRILRKEKGLTQLDVSLDYLTGRSETRERMP